MDYIISHLQFTHSQYYDLNEDEICGMIERSILSEKSGISGNYIDRRLWTRDYVMPKALPADSDQSVGLLQCPESCSICMEEYKNQDKIAMLYYCQHEYHADCIKKWLLKKNVCPICKRLALVPEHFEDWKGDDIHFHQTAFAW